MKNYSSTATIEKELTERYWGGKRRRTWTIRISREQWTENFKELTPIQRCLCVSLKIYAGSVNKAWPSHEKLATELGVSRPTILKNIRILEKKNIIEVERIFGNVNVYHFIIQS